MEKLLKKKNARYFPGDNDIVQKGALEAREEGARIIKNQTRVSGR